MLYQLSYVRVEPRIASAEMGDNLIESKLGGNDG